MESTFLDFYEDLLVDVVNDYTGFGNTLGDVTDVQESLGWAAEGVVSTAPGLIAFARGLFSGDRDMIPKCPNLTKSVPNVDVVSLDCGHNIQKKKPQETNQALLRWLEQQATAFKHRGTRHHHF